VTFTLTLSNGSGAGTATNVSVSDLLPAGYNFVSATGDGAYDDVTGNWTVPSVPAGGSAVLQITARVLGSGSYANVAEVTAADQPDADDTYGDGAGEDWATSAPIPSPVVDLSLTKTVDAPTPAVGTNVVFTLTLSNAATYSPATSVVVADALPAGYAFVSATGDGVYDSGAGNWSVSSVAPGASAVLRSPMSTTRTATVRARTGRLRSPHRRRRSTCRSPRPWTTRPRRWDRTSCSR
jgi:uncharacterized repeat protein (TIGR01451 family)